MVEIGTGSRIPILWTFFSKPEVVISQPCWPLMSTKFGLLIDFDLLKARTSTNTNWPHWLMRALVDHTLPNKLQRSAIAKLNTSQWFYWLVYLSYEVFNLVSKNHLKQSFCYTYLLTHSQPFNWCSIYGDYFLLRISVTIKFCSVAPGDVYNMHVI